MIRDHTLGMHHFSFVHISENFIHLSAKFVSSGILEFTCVLHFLLKYEWPLQDRKSVFKELRFNCTSHLI